MSDLVKRLRHMNTTLCALQAADEIERKDAVIAELKEKLTHTDLLEIPRFLRNQKNLKNDELDRKDAAIAELVAVLREAIKTSDIEGHLDRPWHLAGRRVLAEYLNTTKEV